MSPDPAPFLFPAEFEPPRVDLEKHCRHRIDNTLWDMSIEDGRAVFTCATDGLLMHYGMYEWAQELLYTPQDKPGERYSSIRVRLGPVEDDGGNAYLLVPPEPIGIPIIPTRWCQRCAGLEDGPCEVPHHVNW